MRDKKRIIGGILLVFANMALVLWSLYLVFIVSSWALHFLNLKETIYSKVLTLVVISIFFIISSNKIYLFFQKKLKSFRDRADYKNKNGLLIFLIQINDVLCAFPKRTFLFLCYIIITIMDRFGFGGSLTSDIDVVLGAVFIIGVDRIISNWSKEKAKVYKLLNKFFLFDNDNLADSIIPDENIKSD